MKKYLLHDHLLVRFFSLYIICLVVLVVMWYASYFLLPEGLLHGANLAGRLAGQGKAVVFGHELVKIVVINLGSAMIVVVANRYSTFLGYPLGYVIPVEWIAYYAVLLGTNSFSIPMAHAMAPSFDVLGRSGVYEMSAYTLIATGTYNLGRLTYTKSGHKPHWGAIGFAVVILILANFREAYMILRT